jgi:homoserine O-acetyltransferase
VLVHKCAFEIPELLLECGRRLKNVRVGYETYGELNEARDNAILICHYFTGSSHAAGRYHESDPEPGYWEPLIGPGKAIDTDRFYVVSVDSLCNLNAKHPQVMTTGPRSIDPSTGKPYGASFPVVTIGDFVEVQMRLCSSLGLPQLYAVAGPSMGALQALEWTARYPEFVGRAICAISAGLKLEPYLIAQLNTWCAPIRLDPNFQNGNYADDEEPRAGLAQAFKLVTLDALHPTGVRRLFARRWADREKNPLHSLDHLYSVENALEQTATDRARFADANSFLRIARAVQLFSIEERKERLRARYLFLPASSDILMFPFYSENAVAELRKLGLEATSFTIEGDGGHLDGLNAIGQASDVVREFLA